MYWFTARELPPTAAHPAPNLSCIGCCGGSKSRATFGRFGARKKLKLTDLKKIKTQNYHLECFGKCMNCCKNVRKW